MFPVRRNRLLFAAADWTFPGSVSRTVTSREPHFGQRMRLDSIEIGKPPASKAWSGRQSPSCSPQERTDFSPSRRGLAERT